MVDVDRYGWAVKIRLCVAKVSWFVNKPTAEYGRLINKLEEILRKKDSPREIKDPPYSQYVVLMFSDEPWLERDYVEESLAAHVFASTSVVSRAFLLLSYDPFVQKYPCYELRIAPNKQIQPTQ